MARADVVGAVARSNLRRRAWLMDERSIATRPTIAEWIQGRATHIHFRVDLALDLQATSQLAFPNAITSAVYATPLYAARGDNPTKPAGNGIFLAA